MKTIGIDCRLAGSKHAGIGRYIEELVTRVTLDPDINWVLFLRDEDQITLPKQKNVKIVIAPIPHYSLAEQLKMPGIFARENLDLLHVPHYNVPILYRGKFVVTIHDLLWHTVTNPGATTLSPLKHFLKYQAYKQVVKHAVERSVSIVVPTEHVKKEISHHFPQIHTEKIATIYEGVNEKFSAGSTQYSERESKILFYTGSLYPHKNVMLAVKALEKLPDFELCISSSRSVFVDSFMKQVDDLGLSKRVHHLGRLSDEELMYWYQKSTALVQPSYSEGFGLTGIEALAVGLPVVASDIAVFHEVYGTAFIPFDPHRLDSFVTAIRRLKQINRSELIEKGKRQAALYSWEVFAEKMIFLYAAHV